MMALGAIVLAVLIVDAAAQHLQRSEYDYVIVGSGPGGGKQTSM